MQQMMHSFEGFHAPQDILAAVESGHISSFCLFSHQNVENPAQLRVLNEQLRYSAQQGGLPAPLIGIDQEGGQLMAIREGVTPLSGNMALGATRSPELAYQAGRVLARELLAMGVNLNFAPSLDVNINPNNPVIGVRSFGDDPALVATLGSALIRGLQDNGVLATAKHFPGHGDTDSDTHHASASVPHSKERLEAVELVPFYRAIADGVGAVMTAHLTVSAWDDENPATLSPAVLQHLLRQQLGYDGLIITDAMDMHAVSRFGSEDSIIRALHAGADIILIGHLKDQLALNNRFRDYENPRSLERILTARHRYNTPLPDFSVINSAEHHAIARTIAEKSVTLVKNGGLLPLHPAQNDEIAVVTVPPMRLTPADTSDSVTLRLADYVREYHHNTHAYTLSHTADEAEIGALLAQLERANFVIVGTINAMDSITQTRFVQALHERGKNPIVIALRMPYDLQAFPDVAHYLCTYSLQDPSIRAVAQVLFGILPAEGVLPCQLTGNALERLS